MKQHIMLNKVTYVYGKPHWFFPGTKEDLKSIYRYITGRYSSLFYTRTDGLCGFAVHSKLLNFLRKTYCLITTRHDFVGDEKYKRCHYCYQAIKKI